MDIHTLDARSCWCSGHRHGKCQCNDEEEADDEGTKAMTTFAVSPLLAIAIAFTLALLLLQNEVFLCECLLGV